MQVKSVFSGKLFEGKTVFITGGGSGINLGIAKNFAALGANLAICGRRTSVLENAAVELRALGATVAIASVDVRDFDGVAGALEHSRSELGSVDVLVCGAAGNFMCPVEKLSANGFRSVVDIDLIGAFNTARAAFDQLKQTRGSVLFISAGQAFVPFPHQAHVGAAKAGIDMMMKNLALEWGPYGIRCNSIAPGFVGGTEGTDRMTTPRMREAMIQGTPLGRLGTIDDIGQMAVFLASPLATYVTGTVTVVDGGYYLGGSSRFAHALHSETEAEAVA